ncbi:MAG: stress-induced protein [Flavisolibacter sp.]|nr:stress-induced protein [Flavisolibacter sp.]MBD0294051.1 stress-induced protein [Flavisolibacter sp.]MBD0350327.1 stress-induced protein [Flavisolibacter sp.]MBD0366578.1 stress-induced protein [Flavisolibacter sp.]
MSGRGDSNKAGSSGRGASNQSNQGFDKAAQKGKSTHGDQTGGKRSEPQKKKGDQDAQRDHSLEKEEP